MVSYNGTLRACVEQAAEDTIWTAEERKALAEVAAGIAAREADMREMESPSWDGTDPGGYRAAPGGARWSLRWGHWVLTGRDRGGPRFIARDTMTGYNIGVVE